MDKKRESGWLSKQISSAHDSFSDWPSWMQDAARFEVSGSQKDKDGRNESADSSANKQIAK